jgi:hypothetical protein
MLAKSLADPWADWREQVVAVIRRDFQGVLTEVGDDDIDWEAWRPLYEKGCSAQAAVDAAFLRNVERPLATD